MVREKRSFASFHHYSFEDPTDFRYVFKKLLLEVKTRGATTILTVEDIPLDPDITEYHVD